MKRIIAVVISVSACWFASGCQPVQFPSRAALAPETTIADRSAIESAREWSEKYAELADRHMKLQQTSQASAEENRKLVAQLAKIELDATQTSKELGDANTMLGELNKELAQWKRDVLGFRDELRRAQKVQIDLMSRVVVLLGGEAPDIKVITKTASASEPKGTTGG